MLAEERAVRERIIELNPGAFNHYLNLAKVSAQLGDLESAEATLKMANHPFSPAAAEPYSALSQFNGEAGKLDKARWYAPAIARETTVLRKDFGIWHPFAIDCKIAWVKQTH